MNARFLPRFQNLCNTYNFKPVYLTNYEMVKDTYFSNFAIAELRNKCCEIGLHLHAWNNPPLYDLVCSGPENGLPYLIEYPKEIMREKINVMVNQLKDTFGSDIVSHRSGRWAMNQDYFDLLIENNIKVDCSVTPHISWEAKAGFSQGSAGTNYSTSYEKPYMIKHGSTSDSILEIPVTIRIMHNFRLQSIRHPRIFINEFKSAIFGKPVWLRPDGRNLKDMLTLINDIKDSDHDYIMFMLHSSELMPGGSPTFSSAESVELLYNHLNIIFKTISMYFTGITLADYYLHCMENITKQSRSR